MPRQRRPEKNPFYKAAGLFVRHDTFRNIWFGSRQRKRRHSVTREHTTAEVDRVCMNASMQIVDMKEVPRTVHHILVLEVAQVQCVGVTDQLCPKSRWGIMHNRL